MNNVYPVEHTLEQIFADRQTNIGLQMDSAIKLEQEWNELSPEEKTRIIEASPGWPGWIF